MPITLERQTQVREFAMYAFNPKDPADKRIEIYSGTDANSPGTLLKTIVFPNHSDVRQGWTRFVLDQPLNLPAGSYGIAYHADYEFHSYWAGNAPNGAGFAWARPNDTIDWFKGGPDDFGFVPNFGLRIYGLTATQGAPNGAAVPDRTARANSAPSVKPEKSATPDPGRDTSVPGQVDNHEYRPGTSETMFHVIWRAARPATGTVPAQATR